MEQHNLETQFKEKLNSREIKPTAMAWDRLNVMLTVAEPDIEAPVLKRKRKFSWLYVAASFIGFLLVATVFFNTEEKTIEVKKNAVVIENTIPNKSSKNEIKSVKPEPNSSKTIVNSATQALAQTQNLNKPKIENPTFKTQENIATEIQPNNQKELIPEIKNTSLENTESLLASVEKNPKSGSKNATIKINPADLLSQVDGELQLSFREKALNTITQKYKEAKEALVNRNNQ